VNESETPMSEPSMALDDRLLFFLKHQDQIRVWASLAEEVQDEAADLLKELGSSIVDDPRVNQLGIFIAPQVSGGPATGPVLYRPTWCIEAEGVPDVGIAIGWDRRVDPAGVWPRTSLPYVGVLCSHLTNPGKAIDARLRARTPGHVGDEPKFQKGSYWVVFRGIPPNKNWWLDISNWQQGLVDDLLATWARWAPLVDEAVAAQS
jgi:hypothetical protein